jgi:hypothetical protein
MCHIASGTRTRYGCAVVMAGDFFTVDLLDLLDGTRAYVLAVIEYATRRIRILGVTLHPTGNGPPSRPATSSWTLTSKRASGLINEYRLVA